jgi:hypothetical protein
VTGKPRSRAYWGRAYGDVGWRVFPVAAGAKNPALPAAHPVGDPLRLTCRGECGRLGHGLYDATTDPQQIEEWWGSHPRWNIGIQTGAPGPDVLDIDYHGPKDNGFAALNRIKRAGLAGGQQAIVRTPSTGFHMYYQGTDQTGGVNKPNNIDFRARGGYVVAPPSVTPAGGYVVVDHQPGAGATLSWREVQDVLEPEALREQRALRPSRPAGQPANGKGDEGRVVRVTGFVAAGVPHDRDYRVYWAARELEWAGQLDGSAEEAIVAAALQAGLAGGETEARRSVDSGRTFAQSHSPDSVTRRGPMRAEPSNGTARPGGHEAGDGQRPFDGAAEPGSEQSKEAG